jgi:hypothetical protein
MKRKILYIFVMMLLISTVSVTIGSNENQEINIKRVSNLNESIEVVDQHNPVFDIYGFWFEEGDTGCAQSFIPEHSPLTKVEMVMNVYGNPPTTNYTLSVRESLDGEDIVSYTVNSDDFIDYNVQFIFPDTELTVGMTYWLVLTADNFGGAENDIHFWRSSTDSYENGDMWYEDQGVWKIAEGLGVHWDWAFTTYWRDYAPDNPEIDGPHEGKAQERYDYIFKANDPEGHDVRYYIEWGDGKSFNWMGPYASEEDVTKSHQWASQDNYTIRVKAKDIYGAESGWTELEISMPKNKIITTQLVRLFNNHPYLFPILKRILGLN